MIDMEKHIVKLLREKLPEIDWTTGFPQDFAQLNSGIGCVTQMDNTAKVATSSGVDRITSVAVQIQTWTLTPERRNEMDELIDAAINPLNLTRSGFSHFAQAREDGSQLSRSVLLYSGAYDNKTKQFYTR